MLEGNQIVHLRRLHSVEEGPMCVEDTYIDHNLVPDLIVGGLPVSLYQALEEFNMRPDAAEDRITAEFVTTPDADVLKLEPGRPVLQQLRRATAGARTVLVSRTVFRSDRHVLHVQFGSSAD